MHKKMQKVQPSNAERRTGEDFLSSCFTHGCHSVTMCRHQNVGRSEEQSANESNRTWIVIETITQRICIITLQSFSLTVPSCTAQTNQRDRKSVFARKRSSKLSRGSIILRNVIVALGEDVYSESKFMRRKSACVECRILPRVFAAAPRAMRG
jgi:hypothetical protein